MPAVQPLATSFAVHIDGRELPSEAKLVELVVDDALHLPDLFELTFLDADRLALGVLAAEVGAGILVGVRAEGDAAPAPLIDGEVTSIEVAIDTSGRRVTLRGYDRSHRLFRGRVTAGYQDVTYDDIAKRVAQRAGLRAGTIDHAGEVHEHVAQADEHDWAFLKRLAAEIGFEVVVQGDQLHFRNPKPAEDAPQAVDMLSVEPFALVVGSSLLRLNANLTSAAQVKEVEVRGWNRETKQALTATAKPATDAVAPSVTPAQLAKPFGDRSLVTGSPGLATQSRVDSSAAVLSDAIAAGSAELEGVARGNPALRAGTAVVVSMAGPPFDGKYVLTATRHRYSPEEGYVVRFTVSGRDDRSLLSLTAGGSGGASAVAAAPISGVVTAVVEDSNDPQGECRVRLRFPWRSPDYVSNWAPTVQPGAGKNRGNVVLPHPGDEVLVAFEEGDWNRPFVLGGLYNGVDHAHDMAGTSLLDKSTKVPWLRSIVSANGHGIELHDGTKELDGIRLRTGDGVARIVIDEDERIVEIKCEGKIRLTADMDIDIQSGTGVTIQAPIIKLN
jgi:phage protein D